MPLRVVLANSLRVSERFAALRPYVSLRSCQGGLKFGVKALEVSCLSSYMIYADHLLRVPFSDRHVMLRYGPWVNPKSRQGTYTRRMRQCWTCHLTVTWDTCDHCWHMSGVGPANDHLV